MPLTNQPPMLLNTPTQRDLLANFSARRTCQLDFGKIRLDGQHTTTSTRRADVDQQQLVLCELGDLRLLLILRLYTEQAAEQEQRNLEL